MFMGCSLTCVNALLKNRIFHIIYLYFTPLCPFFDKHADNFLLLWNPSKQNVSKCDKKPTENINYILTEFEEKLQLKLCS